MSDIRPGTQFASDFETTTTAPTRVWQWHVRDIADDSVVCRGTKIEEFIAQAPAGRHFFHNLGFDAAFIIDHLLRNGGYEWVELDQSPKGKAEGRHILRKAQLTSLIGGMGQHYEVSFTNPQGTVVLRDSLRKVPGTLRSLGEAYGADVKKGTTPLHKALPEDYEPTPEEWDYIENDTAILAHVLRAVIAEGYTSMTIGGDCFRDWKRLFHGTYGLEDETPNETFRRMFPSLGFEMDSRIRKAYRGGWTYVRPEMQGRVLTCGGRIYDVNSMYPGVMVQEDYPVGMPVEIGPGERGDEKHPLVIRGAIVSYTIKPGHLPIIPKNAETFGGSGWSNEADEVELWGTEREWSLWEEQYDLTIEEEVGGYKFKSLPGEKMFGPYIAHFMEIKEKEKGPKRQLAKLSLNNLWGKFGTNPMKDSRIPQPAVEGEPIGMPATPAVFDEAIYTAVAVFTTAYARERIVRSAQQNYDRFCYADTDSLHMTGDTEPMGLEIHPTRLGAWDHEGTWTEAIYCRSKAYVERLSDGEISVAMAGLPESARGGLTPETVYDGMTFGKDGNETEDVAYKGKLARKRVVGGLILAPVEWRLDYRMGIVRV